MTAIADSARILCEQSGKTLSIQNNISDIPIGIDYTFVSRILILDEPTAGLDPKERVRFRNLISAFSKDRIVILSTHIVSDVEFIAEDIIMMKDGQILHFGKTQEITTEIDGQVWEWIRKEEYAYVTGRKSSCKN